MRNKIKTLKNGRNKIKREEKIKCKIKSKCVKREMCKKGKNKTKRGKIKYKINQDA
jgi:hypothetical protein